MIKLLSLVALPISGIWFLLAPDFEPALAFITALSTALAARPASMRHRLDNNPALPRDIENNQPPEPPITDSYPKTVGARLKMLCKTTLELSLREMAEFLGIETVSTLERYESGEVEFPLHLIKKIEGFFRISPRYIESGEGTIFRHFFLSQKTVGAFVRDQYTPILACCPAAREDLFCYQLFERKVDGYTRVAFADRPGSFASSGGGRKPVTTHDPTLLGALESLVAPVTRGDPQSPLRWTCKRTRRLATELQALGHAVRARTVARLLRDLHYSLQATRKTKAGGTHPDRNAQFAYINERTTTFQTHGQPVISVDAKKKALVGDFNNGGREWQPRGEPEQVRVYDFPDKELGKAIPYGVYAVTTTVGWVSVGTDHDTAECAVETVR